MSGKKHHPTYDPNLVEVKSKFECEFRRFSVDRTRVNQYPEFHALVKDSHHLPSDMPFTVSYTDPRNGDLLPINNDDNLMRAFTTSMPLLRLFIYRKQEFMLEDMNTRAKTKKKGDTKRTSTLISAPQDFRRVCAIVDADMLPDTVRRVKLLKHSSDRPLGFYIRDGTSVRVTPYGLEKVHGIFISRLVPGGLAESTGLLAVDDEILEVNGIEVLGKSLDQVTDMMVANSQNLIITVKPASLPPATPPRMLNQSMKKGKQAINLGGSGKGALGQTAAKSYGDLPSITAGPSQKAQQSASLQLNRKVNSDLPKKDEGSSWTDSLDSVTTSNGPTSIDTANGKGRESDLVMKRHSISGSLDS